MRKIDILNLGRLPDIGILISPYFDGFTSLKNLYMAFNNLYDIDNLSIPAFINVLHLDYNRLRYFPNVSAHRFPALTRLDLNFNDLTYLMPRWLV